DTDVRSAMGCSRAVTVELLLMRGLAPKSFILTWYTPRLQPTLARRSPGKWVRIPHGDATVSGESALHTQRPVSGPMRATVSHGGKRDRAIPACRMGRRKCPASIRKSGYLATGIVTSAPRPSCRNHRIADGRG